MRQEIGETSKAIIEDDEKKLGEILAQNKDRKDPYWVVLFAKPIKGVTVDGKLPLIKVLKAYYTKPRSQIGMVVGEVDNTRGSIKWEVNLPDVPFGFQALKIEQDGHQAYETSIPNAFVYN